MTQRWYEKGGVQAAVITGVFLVLATVATGLFGRCSKEAGQDPPAERAVAFDFTLSVIHDKGSYVAMKLAFYVGHDVKRETPHVSHGESDEFVIETCILSLTWTTA